MFYKAENDTLLAAEIITGPNYLLLAQDHAEYTYPIHDWYWFDTREEAEAVFQISAPQTPDILQTQSTQ